MRDLTDIDTLRLTGYFKATSKLLNSLIIHEWSNVRFHELPLEFDTSSSRWRASSFENDIDGWSSLVVSRL